MAFVILSAGTLTQSRTHTISVRTFLGVIAAVMLVMLCGGFVAGYAVDRDVPEPVQIQPSLPESANDRVLIDRFGELSGRMVQLQTEAAALSQRISVIRDFEARGRKNVAGTSKPGRLAKTPVGMPSGGPLLRAVPDPETVAAPLVVPAPLVDPNAAAVREGVDPKPGPLADQLARMKDDVERLAETFAGLDRLATGYSLAHMFFPGRAPVSDADVSSTFGNRTDPFRKRLAFHSGVDFAAPKGTPILASAGGRVIFSGRRPEYGLTVEIDHGGGLATRYAHASKLYVKLGQVVLPGQKIAAIGTSGRSTGAHLHFELLKDGRFVDPASYLARF